MTKTRMIIIVGLLVLGGIVVYMMRHKQAPAEATREVTPVYGAIETSVSATGTVQPQNRLEIKPPIGGRVEQILVQEGQMVKANDVLAIMSSTDRAALLDAARLQGEKVLSQWQDVYKPTPLIAPIDAQVIVKSVNPGQTVTPTDPVIVLSDRLIVQSQVDETDVGKVKVGQEATISLDAYPEIKVKGKVDHIYYESKIVNNVTIYQVDIVPERVPDVFRSGMSANVVIIEERKDNVLLVPKEAVRKKDAKSFVFLKQNGEKPMRQQITTGIADDVNIEVVSGLSPQDTVIIRSPKMAGSRSNRPSSSSPFMPSRGGRGR